MREWLVEVRSRAGPLRRRWGCWPGSPPAPRRSARALRDLAAALGAKSRSRSSKVSRGVEKKSGDGGRAWYVESSESDEPSDMQASCAAGEGCVALAAGLALCGGICGSVGGAWEGCGDADSRHRAPASMRSVESYCPTAAPNAGQSPSSRCIGELSNIAERRNNGDVPLW